ncbi:RNA 2',3'-cyclic phosphodiesterase [Rhodobacter capsulatus]|uniref:RNA 2',3'-cyclic phosphodiesterase n=1 Tax=Rhodobacter capsulatus TaxID=1061 RepID=A0A1G7HVB3_RHOCA|nr:RNA 2',3'-cyclic phosphodiesterase [Rhodobacter capsulatus]WER11093.1 RNA 2',3'-cyclic phosphodiesterase [Rhodobacter capsulatus]SDF03999.1 2'-5' RNA ligase [Rhodobacter capsulatus]
MRVFVGILLPEALWGAVAALQGALGCGRPVAEEALHLTLAYLGEVDLPDLERLHEEISALPLAPFEVVMAGLDVIEAGDRTRALVLRLRPSPALEALQAKLVQAVRRAGLDLERRRFRPHVTIVRFGKALGETQAARLGHLLESRGDVVLPAWRVTGFSLIRSHLGREGAQYEVLADYPEPLR